MPKQYPLLLLEENRLVLSLDKYFMHYNRIFSVVLLLLTDTSPILNIFSSALTYLSSAKKTKF